MNKKTQPRQIKIAEDKITKKQIDQALAEGKTHAKFTNKSVQRRLLKNQEKIRRAQQLRENQQKRLNKAFKAASATIPPGGGNASGTTFTNTNPQLTPDTTGLNLVPISTDDEVVNTDIVEETNQLQYRYLREGDEAEGYPTIGFKLVDCHAAKGVMVFMEDRQGHPTDPLLAQDESPTADEHVVFGEPVLNEIQENVNLIKGIYEEHQLHHPAVAEEGRNNAEAMRRGLQAARDRGELPPLPIMFNREPDVSRGENVKVEFHPVNKSINHDEARIIAAEHGIQLS